MFSVLSLHAQTDSSFKIEKSSKIWQLGKLSLPHIKVPKVHLPKLRFPKVKMPQLKYAKIQKVNQVDSGANKVMDFKRYLPVLKKEAFFVYSGINFSKQAISGMDYTLPFNYDVSKINNDVYKPGYFIGARWESVFKNKHLYNIEIGLHKIASGTKYSTVTSLDPFIGEFVQHKADDQFFILNLGANYKKLIPFKNNDKLKLYVLAGPSVDVRLSNQSIHNNVTNSYKKILVRANLGVELDNNGYYTIFMHYKPSISSFTKQPIRTTMNSFELGMMLNVNDIF